MQEKNNTRVVFSQKLRQLMDAKDLTQTQVAIGSGCTQAAISFYLKGERLPGSEELLKLARFFNVQMEDLILDNPGEGYEPDGPPEILQLLNEAHTLDLMRHLSELPSVKRQEVVERFKTALDLFEPRQHEKGHREPIRKESKKVRDAATGSASSALRMIREESKKKPK